MFERFTDRARRAVVLAQEESRRLNHHHIGTEHLLLGMVVEGEGVAAVALTRLGLDLGTVRRWAEETSGRGSTEPPSHIPFTDEAKATMEGALREALKLGHNYIGTEHLLLGIIEQPPITAFLTEQGLSGATIRTAVMEVLTNVVASGRRTGSSTSPGRPAPPARTPGLDWALQRAAELADGDATGTQHVVGAIAENDELAGHEVLVAGGFSSDGLPNPPASWETAGTLDDTPLRAARRAVVIDVDDDGVRVRITDPELRGQLERVLDSPAFADDLRDAIARATQDQRSRSAGEEEPGGSGEDVTGDDS